MCVLTSSRLDDFSDIDGYLYTVVITFWPFPWGEGGSFSFSNTLDKTLIGVALNCSTRDCTGFEVRILTKPPISRVMTEIALDSLTHKLRLWSNSTHLSTQFFNWAERAVVSFLT